MQRKVKYINHSHTENRFKSILYFCFKIFKKFEFYFPNAFSPNGNSINETFGLSPSQAPFIKTYRLRVFNRWGEMVFESKDPLSTWKAEKAQLGMYIYTADIRDIYNQLHQLKGVVMLVE